MCLCFGLSSIFFWLCFKIEAFLACFRLKINVFLPNLVGYGPSGKVVKIMKIISACALRGWVRNTVNIVKLCKTVFFLVSSLGFVYCAPNENSVNGENYEN